MKHKRILLLLLALLQIAAPLYIAWRWEDVLQTGEQYRFRTAPFDPGDVLRGRYLQLAFAQRKAPAAIDVKSGTKAFACLKPTAEGYAEIYEITATKPVKVPFISVHVYTVHDREAYFQMPFGRYYVNEKEASQLEKRYQDKISQTSALVRIKNGYAVLESIEGLE